jgi:hypothetical protein
VGNYVVSNIVVLFVDGVGSKAAMGRSLLLRLLPPRSGGWNLVASLTMPASYVSTYGPLATPPYAAFICGPFASNPALFVVPVTLGQLAIGIMATGTGGWVRLAMLGSAIFLLAIAPTGVGSAFPFSICGVVAAALLFRRWFSTSLFEDMETLMACTGRPARPHGYARLHR